jgi:very-short-patch-repair endonuclease
MQKKGICNKPTLKALRRELRKNPTPAESALWEQLRAGRLSGTQWRRQYSIGDYIVDFYCPKAHLCVELDGNGHFTMSGDTYDYDRTKFLNSKGVKVVRFENREVWNDINRVLDAIKHELGVLEE